MLFSIFLITFLYYIRNATSIDSNITRITITSTKNVTTLKRAPNKNDVLKRFSGVGNPKKLKFLLWFSNNDGIFSQFLQMKIMHYVAQNLHKRTLLVAPIKSMHMPNRTIILCDIFKLPSTIQCLNNEEIFIWNFYNKDMKCLTDIKVNIMLRSIGYGKSIEKVDVVCYKGLVTFLGASTRRDAVLNAVDFPIPNLVIHKRYMENLSQYKKYLGLNNNYTVIHWRRGDQLSSRCKQGRDKSINCNDVNYLISFVHNNVKDKSVYIATNDKNDNNELQLLSNAGFLLYNQSYISNVTNDDLSAFILDIALMLDSSTFLGWGISEVNDVIENQRMRMKKSFCKTNENLLEEIVFPTWCANRNKTLYSSNFSDVPLSSNSHHHANVNHKIHTDNNHDKISSNHNNGNILREILKNVTSSRVQQHHHHQQQHKQQQKQHK